MDGGPVRQTSLESTPSSLPGSTVWPSGFVPPLPRLCRTTGTPHSTVDVPPHEQRAPLPRTLLTIPCPDMCPCVVCVRVSCVSVCVRVCIRVCTYVHVCRTCVCVCASGHQNHGDRPGPPGHERVTLSTTKTLPIALGVAEGLPGPRTEKRRCPVRYTGGSSGEFR